MVAEVRRNDREPTKLDDGRIDLAAESINRRGAAAAIARREDGMLMARVAAKDEGAAAELHARFAPLIFTMAKGTLNGREDAQDAVQDVMLKLVSTAHRFDHTRSGLVTWVMTLTKRHCIDQLRRRQCRLSAGGLEEGMAGAGLTNRPRGGADPSKIPAGRMIELEDFHDRFRKAMARLPVLQATIVERAYFGGRTLREISEELDTPLGTVKSALSRGLERIRELGYLDDFGPARR